MKRTADLALLGLGTIALLAVLSGTSTARVDGPPGDALTQSFTDREILAQAAPKVGRTQPPHVERREDADAGSPARFRRSHLHASRPLSPEMMALCMRVAEDIDPDLARRLESLRRRDAAQFAAKLQQSRRLIALAELRKQDPSLYDLKLIEMKVDSEVSRLAAALRRAKQKGEDSEAKAIEESLRQQVILQLVFRHKNRDDYLCRLRELVERLENELQQEKENFNTILEQRMAELMRDAEEPADGRSTTETRLILPAAGAALE